MRIGIDGHQLNGKPQGIRTYLIQLLRALAKVAAPEDEVRVFSFDPAATSVLVPGVHRRVFPASAKLRLPFVVPALELWNGLDLFHSQYLAPPVSFVPEVVSIYDVLFESHPELFEGAFSGRSRALIRRSAERAGMVLTASQFSKDAILEHYDVSEERVAIVGAGVDHESFRPFEEPPVHLLDRYGLERPYIIAVGRLEPRKNLERLMRAHQRLGGEVTLALVGVRDYRFDEILAQASAARVKLLGAVPDEDLPGLYALSEALAFPSLVEGFGMPLLEAMACETPVLVSRRGAMPEVAGDAALYVEDPEDEDALEHGLRTILEDRELRRRLAARGRERALEFTWEETARRTLEAYRRAL